MGIFLSIDGFGDVHEAHFESGLELARGYFSENNLDYLECYESYKRDNNSILGQHWSKAEDKANLALYAFNLQDNSILELVVVNRELE